MMTKDTCPDKANHTPCPEGYIAWHEWAAKMMKTHRVVRCKTCRLWTNYVPKNEALAE